MIPEMRIPLGHPPNGRWKFDTRQKSWAGQVPTLFRHHVTVEMPTHDLQMNSCFEQFLLSPLHSVLVSGHWTPTSH